MNITLLKRIRYERYLIAAIAITVMVFIAGLSDQQEVIFPEMMALVTGAWVSEMQQWNTNKRKMFILVSLAAFAGVATVKYVHLPVYGQLAVSFIFAAAAVIISKTNFIPFISALILPIYLQTTSLVYPVSVTIMTLILIFVQWLMEKRKLRPKNIYVPFNFDVNKEIIKWSKLFLFLMVVSFIPFQSKSFYFIAPPLIVTLAAFADTESPARRKPLRVFWLLCIAAALGTFVKLILNLEFGLPLTICVIISLLVLFWAFAKTKTIFPPAGALMLLPLIISKDDLLYYPLEVTIGSAIFILSAMVIFSPKIMPKK